MKKTILLILGLLTLNACSSYKEYKAHKQRTYLSARESKPLVYPVTVAGLYTNSRYEIPNIKNKHISTTIEPPDYRN